MRTNQNVGARRSRGVRIVSICCVVFFAIVCSGLVAAGWKVGPPSIDTMDDVVQTNIMLQKDAMAATITIYETTSWDWTNKLLLGTEAPSQALSFGRTVTRVSVGAPDKQNGVTEAFRALSDFKKAAREKATGEEKPKVEDPPAE